MVQVCHMVFKEVSDGNNGHHNKIYSFDMWLRYHFLFQFQACR